MTELHATATLKDSAFKTLADSFATSYNNTIAIDQQHRITWISKGYRQFLGLSHNPVGEPITRYIHNSFFYPESPTVENRYCWNCYGSNNSGHW
ncbi:PAS domain-containing protein [Vibrio sp. M60_M31a]